MARQGGKAANRRERQRRAQRRALQRPAPTARPIPTDVGDAVASAAEGRTDAPRPAPGRPSAASRGMKADPRFAVSGPSRLGDRAAADYHYVLRDLRSIGILVAGMAILLAVAVVAFGMLEIGPR
ncbi:MAG: hypothetical protein OEW24_05350 [Chloroflexota bacterium]|nr:hypothetical protein [Chloroflexota bacterium]